MPSNSGTTIRLIPSLGFFQEGTYPTGIWAEECFDILGIVTQGPQGPALFARRLANP